MSDKIYIQFAPAPSAHGGETIRKWSREPFDGATCYELAIQTGCYTIPGKPAHLWGPWLPVQPWQGVPYEERGCRICGCDDRRVATPNREVSDA